MSAQALLFPDPRPLVERLGTHFFRQVPRCPGVYLMRDSANAVLYIGKAKNLHARLGSYHVANPDRMPRRHLRLLRAVVQIELQECADERAALARESELLRALKPRFNRAGTWPGPARFLVWRCLPLELQLRVSGRPEPGWETVGPLGVGADIVRSVLARLIWCATHSESPISAMPHNWFSGRHSRETRLRFPEPARSDCEQLAPMLRALFSGQSQHLADWVREKTAGRSHPFETAACAADLEAVLKFAERQTADPRNLPQNPALRSSDGLSPISSATPDLFSLP